MHYSLFVVRHVKTARLDTLDTSTFKHKRKTYFHFPARNISPFSPYCCTVTAVLLHLFTFKFLLSTLMYTLQWYVSLEV